MVQFDVADEGYLCETAVADLASWYQSRCPTTDEVAFEAHFMLMRAYSTLNMDSPFELRGGLTRARYNVLRLLAQAPERRLPMTEMVQGLSVSPTNITKLVDGLVKDKFVRRVSDRDDKRKFWVELMPEGLAAFEVALPDVGEHVRSLWQGLSRSELKLLIHLLAKFRLHKFTSGATGEMGGASVAEAAKVVPVGMA
jgi:DNA-binding MarR family transcriptional regulator